MLDKIHSSEALMAYINAARINALKEPQDSFDRAEKALQMARERGWLSEEAAALFVMALSCRSMTQLELCYQYALASYKLYVTLLDDVGIATALNLLGVVYFYYGKMESAMSYFLRALHHIEGQEDPLTESRILNNLGEVYRESGDLDAAFESYQKAFVLCEFMNMKANIAVILENIGEVFYRKQAYELSYHYFNQSFDMLLELNDSVALAEVENKLGKMLFLQGQREEATLRCMNALNRLEAMGNTFFAIDVLMTLAEIKQDEGSTEFLEYWSKAVFHAEVLSARKPLRKLYKLFADYYEGQGNFELALYYFRKFHHIELEIESTMVSQKLEMIKIEVNKAFEDEGFEKLKDLNKQLEKEIVEQAVLLNQLVLANKHLDDAVTKDELTQILNRRGINEKLTDLWENKAYDGFFVSMLMIDIDHFKQFNDLYGHIRGDKCLQQVTAVMADTLERLGDKAFLLGRYGGEEFVCVLVGADEKETAAQAEALRAAVQSTEIHLESLNQVTSVTISIGGVVGRRSQWPRPQEVFVSADQALYKAKNSGRNKVCLQRLGKISLKH